LGCETQESIGAPDGFEELPTATPHDNVSMEIELGKTLNINPKLSDSQKKTTPACSSETQRSLCLGLLRYEGNSY